MSVVDERVHDLDAAVALGQALVRNLEQVVLGSEGALVAAAVAALSGGHLLIEDVPGVGKTVLARSLATSLGAELSRVQGHPDLLPSDITGVSVFMPDTGQLGLPSRARLRPRRPRRRAQPHAAPHAVRAARDDGGAPGQRRRPVLAAAAAPLRDRHPEPALAAGHLPAGREPAGSLRHGHRHRLSRRGGRGEAGAAPRRHLRPGRAQRGLHPARSGDGPSRRPSRSSSPEAVAAYAVELCRASRTAPGVHLGASPRAAIWLIRAAQAHAVLDGRGYVVPDDVKAVAVDCLSHRILVVDAEEGAGQSAAVVREAPRSDASTETVSRWARPARPWAPMLAAVMIIGLWWLVAHNAGSGWVQVLGDLVFGALLIGIVAPAVVVTRLRVSVRSAPADGIAGPPGGHCGSTPAPGCACARWSHPDPRCSSGRAAAAARWPTWSPSSPSGAASTTR